MPATAPRPWHQVIDARLRTAAVPLPTLRSPATTTHPSPAAVALNDALIGLSRVTAAPLPSPAVPATDQVCPGCTPAGSISRPGLNIIKRSGQAASRSSRPVGFTAYNWVCRSATVPAASAIVTKTRSHVVVWASSTLSMP